MRNFRNGKSGTASAQKSKTPPIQPIKRNAGLFTMFCVLKRSLISISCPGMNAGAFFEHRYYWITAWYSTVAVAPEFKVLIVADKACPVQLLGLTQAHPPPPMFATA